MRSRWLLIPVVIACCASAGDAFDVGSRMTAEATVASAEGSHAAEASLRELSVRVKGKTSYAVQFIVLDPATGVFWTETLRKPSPLQAQTLWKEWYAPHRFVSNDGQIAAFRLRDVFLFASASTRRALSLGEAEEQTLDEVRRDLVSTWPIANASPKGPTRVNLEAELGGSFLLDSVFHPALLGLTIDSIAFADGQWVVSIRNERNETGRLFFTEELQYLRAERLPNDGQDKDR